MSWYLAQYHRNRRKVRLITKAWFSGYALAGAVLPNARFDLVLDDQSLVDGSIDLSASEETNQYIQDELLADADKWLDRASNWVKEIGFNDLIAHQDFVDEGWLSHPVMLQSDLDWFYENNIEVVQ